MADLNPTSTLPVVRMQDDLNIEIAGTLSEGEDKDGKAPPPRTGWEEVVEILEAFLLAIVAIATAWSGYQAARWDGHEAELYGQASTIRVRADQLLTLGGQQRLLDVTTFNTWIEARFEGRTELTGLYERRFSPEYEVAFDAWLATDPFSNPEAPPGPSFMPEYVNPQLERGAELNELSSRTFDEGTIARSRADDYIRTTVMLATVLFLIALSQRFKVRGVRYGVLGVAGGLMVLGLVMIITFPRF